MDGLFLVFLDVFCNGMVLLVVLSQLYTALRTLRQRAYRLNKTRIVGQAAYINGVLNLIGNLFLLAALMLVWINVRGGSMLLWLAGIGLSFILAGSLVGRMFGKRESM